MDTKTSTRDEAEAPRAPLPSNGGSPAAPAPKTASDKGLLSKLRERLQKRIRGRSKQGANIYPLY